MKKILHLIILCMCTANLQAQNQINVKLANNLNGPYTGRLFVYTLSDTTKQFGMGLSDTEPAFALDVKNWKNGERVIIGKSALSYLKPIDSLKEGYYKIVAILDTNTKERAIASPGNLYSRKEGLLHIVKGTNNMADVTLDSSFPQPRFMEKENVKEVIFLSPLLTRFRKESIYIKAGVILPPSYNTDTTRTYPVIYVIPGWTGTHRGALAPLSHKAYGVGEGKEKIVIFLNPETQTPYGLHAFVDSRVNGPWGKAFVEEFIPYIQKKYRGSTNAANTFVTGQSSGGYGALWLALKYPTAFGGCWATSPDPVDFSNYLGINLYTDKNYYTDNNGTERPFFKLNGVFQTTLRKGEEKELFEGDGGQQQSFEAEFGVPDKYGRPKPLFDRETGAIDKKVVAEWMPYDLGLFIQKNWTQLKPLVAGKIRIYAGDNDNFFLNESVLALSKKAGAVNADIKVIIVPGADHFSVRVPALGVQMQREMDELIK